MTVRRRGGVPLPRNRLIGSRRQVTGQAILPGDPEGREPLFAVGMRVVHTKHNFRGVVYHWDHKYVSNQEWLFRLQGSEMDAWKEQPFYKVRGCAA